MKGNYFGSVGQFCGKPRAVWHLLTALSWLLSLPCDLVSASGNDYITVRSACRHPVSRHSSLQTVADLPSSQLFPGC